MTFNPKDYAVGDVIKIRQTFEVVEGDPSGSQITGRDVKSGEYFIFWPANDTMRVEMVKRRAPRPKPKAGEILTGKEIGEHKWKRGTTIRCVRSEGGFEIKGLPALVLFPDGKWHDVEGFSSYEFDDLNSDAGFEILFIA